MSSLIDVADVGLPTGSFTDTSNEDLTFIVANVAKRDREVEQEVEAIQMDPERWKRTSRLTFPGLMMPNAMHDDP